MKYSNIPSARAVVYHCKARQLKNIVISPGSRNAPLTLGFTSDPFFKCFSIVDERSAAFFALGIAQQTGKPVVLLCTSGSALLNYYPAVAEAFYSDMPLVVISADRPTYKIDIGDGQTIRQDKVFERHIGCSVQLRQDTCHAVEELKQWRAIGEEADTGELNTIQEEVVSFNDLQLNTALNLALSENCPVHINVPFEEPLYGMQEKNNDKFQINLPDTSENKSKSNLQELLEIWKNSARKLIIIGVQQPGSVSEEILDLLAADPSVAVLTETTSNMKRPDFVNSIDSVIAPIELASERENIFDQLQPDLLITLGGLLVSKKIKAFLREYQPGHHWHIHEKKAFDTFRSLTQHITMVPDQFFRLVTKESGRANSNYGGLWNMPNDAFKDLRQKYLGEIPFSDLIAFDYIFKAIPENYQLQLANSSTIRYSQLFDLNPSLSVYCNRGTSGIDGSTSTAIGAALYSQQPTLLVSGDLSFLYDINAFWNDYVREDFRIIVINNGGGGIFRILPGVKDDPRFERFFETTHSTRIEEIAAAYGLEYFEADDKESLKKGLEEFFGAGKQARILEIRTPRTINDKVLLRYFEYLSSHLYS